VTECYTHAGGYTAGVSKEYILEASKQVQCKPGMRPAGSMLGWSSEIFGTAGNVAGEEVTKDETWLLTVE